MIGRSAAELARAFTFAAVDKAPSRPHFLPKGQTMRRAPAGKHVVQRSPWLNSVKRLHRPNRVRFLILLTLTTQSREHDDHG